MLNNIYLSYMKAVTTMSTTEIIRLQRVILWMFLTVRSYFDKIQSFILTFIGNIEDNEVQIHL